MISVAEPDRLIQKRINSCPKKNGHYTAFWGVLGPRNSWRPGPHPPWNPFTMDGFSVLQADTKAGISTRPGKTVCKRAVISREGERFVGRLPEHQSSVALAALSRANGLMTLPSESGGVKAGRAVKVRLLGDQAWWVKRRWVEEEMFWIRDSE